jgi:hypothetical protein
MGGGLYLGGRQDAGVLHRLPLGALIVGVLLLAIMMWTAFRHYTVQFGFTLYRDFLLLEKKEEKPAKVAEAPDEGD